MPVECLLGAVGWDPRRAADRRDSSGIKAELITSEINRYYRNDRLLSSNTLHELSCLVNDDNMMEGRLSGDGKVMTVLPKARMKTRRQIER